MTLQCVAYLQIIDNLAPLIFREAGSCGHRVFLPESSAPWVQFLQVTLTEIDQMRKNALIARPSHKVKHYMNFLKPKFPAIFSVKFIRLYSNEG